jgi:exosortase C (VPDSG-CTERM-specific)
MSEPNLNVSPPATAVRGRPLARVWVYGIFLAALVAAFSGTLIALFKHASGSDLHSHIVLIPVVSIYLLVLQRRRLPVEYHSSVAPGLVLLITALAAIAAGLWGPVGLSHNDFLALMTFSFVCFVAAGGFLFMGLKWMAVAAFPIGFLVFMIPLPDRMVEWLEVASQVASTEAAYLFFKWSGTPVFRQDATFWIPGITLRVAQECSGIRSSWVLFITSLVASHLFLKSPLRRAVLVAFVIPLGIVRNGFRILTIGLLCVHIGRHMIDSPIHHRGGPIFFALSLVPLFLVLWWLRRGETRRSPPAQPKSPS